MKKLKVPYLVTLDVLDLSSAGYLLESKAHREYIDVINLDEILLQNRLWHSTLHVRMLFYTFAIL